MESMIDIVGSAVLAGIVILLVFQLNSSLSNANFQTTLDVSTQENAIVLGNIMEYDLRKIGYKVSRNVSAITYADTNGNIKFKSDINNDGKLDSVQYKVSKTADKKHLIVTRTVNVSPAIAINFGVDTLKVSYYDSTGASITFPTPTDSASLAKIRSLRVHMFFQNLIKLADSTYPPAAMYWEKYFTMKNLQARK